MKRLFCLVLMVSLLPACNTGSPSNGSNGVFSVALGDVVSELRSVIQSGKVRSLGPWKRTFEELTSGTYLVGVAIIGVKADGTPRKAVNQIRLNANGKRSIGRYQADIGAAVACVNVSIPPAGKDLNVTVVALGGPNLPPGTFFGHVATAASVTGLGVTPNDCKNVLGATLATGVERMLRSE